MRLLLLAAACLIACSNPVREDRTIEWSADGDRVAFQHGDHGVYVANADGGPAEKIHEPGEDVVATSTPLWAPDGERLIFTTATGGPKQRMLFAEPNPAGNLFFEQPARYTCWLREAERSRTLFTADVGHVGYVAANLAVQWHPSGNAILFVDARSGNRHGLHSFDLATHRRTRAFPHDAEALVFDRAPDGSRVVCVLDGEEHEETHGMWIGTPGGTWARVPGATPARGASDDEGPGAITRVRAMRPVWSPDGSSFAFSVRLEVGFALRLRDTETRTLATGKHPFRDLQWHPDGERLGYRAGGAIHVVRPGEPAGPRLNGAPARRFAGWNAAGTVFAYTTPDEIPYVSGPVWSFLLVPDARARDAVRVRDATGDREVFRGMRVTFPNWSPTKDELSLWFTFAPTHRMPASTMLGWGLLPGDPAAIFRPGTGTIQWLTVDKQEEAQVAHYHQLRGDYEEAWRWYERAGKGERSDTRPNARPLFRYHCLSKLGRHKEALRELAAYRGEFLTGGGDLVAPDSLLGSLMRALYYAEVMCSLDSSEAALAHLRKQPHLGDAVAVAQLLLVHGRYGDYVDWMLARVAPGLFTEREPMLLAGFLDIVILLPMLTDSFMELVSPETSARAAARWTELRNEATDPRVKGLIDLALAASHRRAGNTAAADEARDRARSSGTIDGWLDPKDPDALARTLRRWP